MGGLRCPNCRFVCNAQDNFCQRCGAKLGAETPPASPQSHDEPSEVHVPRALIWLLDLFPGLTRLSIIVGFMVTTAVALVGLQLTMAMLGAGVWISMFFVGAGSVVVYWVGVCWMLVGYFCVPVEAMGEFTERHWVAFVLFTAIPLSAIIALMKMAASAQ